MNPTPLISVVFVVKNGMPYIKKSIPSLVSQNYKNYELIVQDSLSTDGTIEYIQSFPEIPNLRIESAADSSKAEGYNKALSRCQGEIIFSLDADNVLEDNALTHAVQFFNQFPEAAAILGGYHYVDSDGHILHTCSQLPTFDLLHLLLVDFVPNFEVSFFSRAICGDNLFMDLGENVMQDFDMWLRISHLPIITLPFIVCHIRDLRHSQTGNPNSYDGFIRRRTFTLQRYLSKYGNNPLLKSLYKNALAGIYTWAAESILGLEGVSPKFLEYSQQSYKLYPNSRKLNDLFKSAGVKITRK